MTKSSTAKKRVNSDDDVDEGNDSNYDDNDAFLSKRHLDPLLVVYISVNGLLSEQYGQV